MFNDLRDTYHEIFAHTDLPSDIPALRGEYESVVGVAEDGSAIIDFGALVAAC